MASKTLFPVTLETYESIQVPYNRAIEKQVWQFAFAIAANNADYRKEIRAVLVEDVSEEVKPEHEGGKVIRVVATDTHRLLIADMQVKPDRDFVAPGMYDLVMKSPLTIRKHCSDKPYPRYRKVIPIESPDKDMKFSKVGTYDSSDGKHHVRASLPFNANTEYLPRISVSGRWDIRQMRYRDHMGTPPEPLCEGEFAEKPYLMEHKDEGIAFQYVLMCLSNN